MSLANKLDAQSHARIMTAGLRGLLKAISESGGEARIVGGVVRDAFAGKEIVDVDLAVNLPPDKVTDLLEKAGIKVVPTGLTHGTVTAVVDHKGYEITTLRHDVETDGRHAKVAFTDDWQADAARRDFTFNALYADADGNIYDYFGGREDLKEGRVRFIGNAETRIHEDVLRILRYFRFFAWYGRGTPDTEALQACRNCAPLLQQLSAERVWREISKLLLAPDPAPVWQLMIDYGIVPYFLSEASNVDRLAHLVRVEKNNEKPDSIRRLAALVPADEDSSKCVARRLRLSNTEKDRLQSLATLPKKIKLARDELSLRKLLYVWGTDRCLDGLFLCAADNPKFDIAKAKIIIEKWENPVFPVRGADILELGISPGPRIEKTLRTVEDWWIEKNFQPTRDECLDEARRSLM